MHAPAVTINDVCRMEYHLVVTRNGTVRRSSGKLLGARRIKCVNRLKQIWFLRVTEVKEARSGTLKYGLSTVLIPQ